jgi:hypothetical protein
LWLGAEKYWLADVKVPGQLFLEFVHSSAKGMSINNVTPVFVN